MPSGVEASWWILLFVYKCLQRSVLGRGGSSTNQQSLTALHSPKCVCEPFGRSCVFIGCAGSQPIMFIAALGEVCCWMRSCQLSWHRWLSVRFLRSSANQPIIDGAAIRDVYFARATAGRPSCVYTLVGLCLKQGFQWLSYCVITVSLFGDLDSNLECRLLMWLGQIRIVGVDLVESIGKRSVLRLETTTNR
jgi:hypothetical protein